MALHPPPGLTSGLQPGARTEILGVPSISHPIQYLPTNTESSEGSVRTWTPLKVLGQGSFSTVWACNWHSGLRPQPNSPPLIENTRFGEGTRLIALKSYVIPDERELSTVKELEVLRTLPPHPNLITLYDYFFTPEDRRLYLAIGAMEGNLYQLIKARKARMFAGGLVSSILHQTVVGLDFLHSNNYFHRDLIPENILVTTTGLFNYIPVPVAPNTAAAIGTPMEKDIVVIIKLSDFSLARETSSNAPYTEYVTVRWYRAPEVILRAPRYTSAVDMWALGVITAEILNLVPLFPGQNEINQLARFCEVLGHPSDAARVDRNGDPLDGGAWPEGLALASALGFQFPAIIPRPFSSLFQPTIPHSLLGCLKELLIYDPQRRLTSRGVLDHQYFRDTAAQREFRSPQSQ
ncbi:hypothetical protein GALMADRAFT_226248 [Galerina marginata CBS 339.88]|uniref:Protein kinase domain-containing protein n=1 Tax=Galerina marginata (strain CBS 339.88) TaxID=685588 RepID=A0A067SXK0_GALM3|nr:hypothetical protein GALMADRAFT_226248 [Galerina marginata CBS 339.88]